MEEGIFMQVHINEFKWKKSIRKDWSSIFQWSFDIYIYKDFTIFFSYPNYFTWYLY
jgi:hypothetical protein